MEPGDPLGARCAAIVRCLAEEEAWRLSDEEQTALAERACAYLLPGSSNAQVRAVVSNVRRDAKVVESLRCGERLGHCEAWSEWLRQARAILRHAGLDWARDEAVDLDDLAQIALLELTRSLPSYRYASRFSTWAYQVITRGVQRHLRDLSAEKRVGDIDRGVDPTTLEIPVVEKELPECRALDRALVALVEDELKVAMGRRNAEVFLLWVREDLSAETIGRKVGLSVARVHAIIAKARSHLREQTMIQHWYEVSAS